MKILVLNWRDILNPKGGGAEVLTHEMARGWVKAGHEVTQISAGFRESSKTQILDGVKIIRLGNAWTVHVLAFFYYMFNLKGKIDVIIDEVHGLPFFSILYEPKKTVLFACEVAEKIFFEVFPLPIAHIGVFLEKMYLLIYKNTPALVISSSTKKDLIDRGFKAKKIIVLPMGLTTPKFKKYPKEKNPTLIYLSRINKQKGIEDAIEAFRIIKKNVPSSRFWIVGTGSPGYINEINRKILKYKLTSSVKFFGFVSERNKFMLLSKASFLIFPSVHEGWGLVIAEAGLVGTPTAVYDVAGVRDVVRNGERGIITKSRRPDLLAEAVIKMLKNDKLYQGALNSLKSFKSEVGWDKTSKVSLDFLKKYEVSRN